MRVRMLIAAVVMAVGCLWSATALAAPGWTPATTFPTPADTTGLPVSIAYQTGGTATVAYLEFSASPLHTVLHVGVIPPGGSYQEQIRIASTPSAVPIQVVLAEAPNGAAAVAWTSLLGTNFSNDPCTYAAAYRPAGSATWSSPTTLGTDSVKGCGSVQPAIAADGTAAVGVTHVDPALPAPGGDRIDVALLSPPGTWGAPVRISSTTKNSLELGLGFDSHDDVTAAFDVSVAAGKYTLVSTNRSFATGTWDARQNLTHSDANAFVYINGAQPMDVAADGSAVVSFQYIRSPSPDQVVNAVTRSGETGAWTTPVDLTPGGGPNNDASAPLASKISGDDEAYLLYGTFASSTNDLCVGALRAHVGGSFGAPHCISPVGFGNPSGGISFLGNDPYFAWAAKQFPSDQYSVQATRWLDGAAQPDPPTTLEGPSATELDFGSLVPDRDGGVAAFWPNAAHALRVSAFDAGGPNLTSAAVPSTGVVGRPVSMSAAFVDLWTGLGAGPSWSFGDGTSASGAQVNHTYTQPGTYAITATVADGFGNTTSSKYVITITSAAPVLSDVSQSARKWSERKHKRHGHKKAPSVGTTFKFTLSEPASVELVFTHKVGGRIVAHKCKAQTRHNRKHKRCTFTSTAGTLAVSGHTGVNIVNFKGGLPHHHKLHAGSYKVAITATEAGQRSATDTLSFRIVSP